jgi:hypothetical protein
LVVGSEDEWSGSQVTGNRKRNRVQDE